MKQESAIRRAQVYGFLSAAFLYPRENWTQDLALVAEIVTELGWTVAAPEMPVTTLRDLQAEHRHTFGVTGSLCYETEYGLPHEYRQSQEMADIAGFYRAFGFQLGGAVPERPDHVSVELEFMHAMALKEAYALEIGSPEHADTCQAAQGLFLQDHLGRWIELFAQSVNHNSQGSLYTPLARLASSLVRADANRLGISLDEIRLDDVQHTPFDPYYSCASCEVAGIGEQAFVPTNTINTGRSGTAGRDVSSQRRE